MTMTPVQTFSDEDRIYDGLSVGVFVVEESRLLANVGDPISVLYGDDVEEADDYLVHVILPLGADAASEPSVAVFFSNELVPSDPVVFSVDRCD